MVDAKHAPGPMQHSLARIFTHWTDAELYAAEKICAETEGLDCFGSINLNKKMTYLQMARNRDRASAHASWNQRHG